MQAEQFLSMERDMFSNCNDTCPALFAAVLCLKLTREILFALERPRPASAQALRRFVTRLPEALMFHHSVFCDILAVS